MKKVIVILIILVTIMSMFCISSLADTELNIDTPDSVVQSMIYDFIMGLSEYTECSDSAAAQLYVDYYNRNKSEYPYFAIYDHKPTDSPSNGFTICMSKEPIYIDTIYKSGTYYIGINKGIYGYAGNLSTGLDFYEYAAPFGSDGWAYSNVKINTTNANEISSLALDLKTKWTTLPYMANHNVIYSPVNPYFNEGLKGSVFFYPVSMDTPPLLNPNPQTLMGVMAEVRSLIPYLIVFLIGLLGFYKAWQFLLTQLRRA